MKLLSKNEPKPVVVPQTTYTLEVTAEELVQLRKAMGKATFGHGLFSELKSLVEKEGLL